MNVQTLALLACPFCHGPLTLEPHSSAAPLEQSTLVCPACYQRFPVINGIPRFIDKEALTGPNKPMAHLYDRISGLYLAG